ncbi:MAG TPA: hypothetical protein VF331_01545 [Polyangiales bacterium]
MPAADRTPRPPLAKSPEGPAGAFGALLSSAVEDPATAQGLALAYASLDTRRRLQIIDAIVNDAQAEGIGASAVLASLLPFEEDPEVAQRIAELMSVAGDAGLRTSLRTRAWLAGDEQGGGAVVVRPLHGAFVEVLTLAWDDKSGITQASFEPLVHHDKAASPNAGVAPQLRFEEMPVSYAIDAVTSVLWNHRRLHAQLPECVKHFADLFWIERTPEAGSHDR